MLEICAEMYVYGCSSNVSAVVSDFNQNWNMLTNAQMLDFLKILSTVIKLFYAYRQLDGVNLIGTAQGCGHA
jgi:hypothetical protein